MHSLKFFTYSFIFQRNNDAWRDVLKIREVKIIVKTRELLKRSFTDELDDGYFTAVEAVEAARRRCIPSHITGALYGGWRAG